MQNFSTWRKVFKNSRSNKGVYIPYFPRDGEQIWIDTLEPLVFWVKGCDMLKKEALLPVFEGMLESWTAWRLGWRQRPKFQLLASGYNVLPRNILNVLGPKSCRPIDNPLLMSGGTLSFCGRLVWNLEAREYKRVLWLPLKRYYPSKSVCEKHFLHWCYVDKLCSSHKVIVLFTKEAHPGYLVYNFKPVPSTQYSGHRQELQ